MKKIILFLCTFCFSGMLFAGGNCNSKQAEKANDGQKAVHHQDDEKNIPSSKES